MSFAWSCTAFDLACAARGHSVDSAPGAGIEGVLIISSNQPVATQQKLKLFMLILALVATASCKPGQTAANSNSVDSAVTGNDQAPGTAIEQTKPCSNLNLATAEELVRLPGIGELMALRIIEYRERRGRFRRPEEIIIIEGFSERKYRDIAGMICVE